MIVDDEPINIKVTQKYLKLAGYQHIIGVTDPRTVLSRIAAGTARRRAPGHHDARGQRPGNPGADPRRSGNGPICP